MRVPTRTDRPWMPDYGIATDSDGLLPWSWAVDHLRAARRFWVSSVNVIGQVDSAQPGGGSGLRQPTPHISAVWAVWTDDALWYGEGFPDVASNPLFAVVPDVVIGIVETDFVTKATRWTFAPPGPVG